MSNSILTSNKNILPNINMIIITRDQTLSHLHHAPELGIKLPENFNLNTYEELQKSEKVKYAKQIIDQEIINNYMFAIADALNGQSVDICPGIAGEQEINVILFLKEIQSGDFIFSVVRETGQHITSYPMTAERLKSIASASKPMWVWNTRKFI